MCEMLGVVMLVYSLLSYVQAYVAKEEASAIGAAEFVAVSKD